MIKFLFIAIPLFLTLGCFPPIYLLTPYTLHKFNIVENGLFCFQSEYQKPGIIQIEIENVTSKKNFRFQLTPLTEDGYNNPFLPVGYVGKICTDSIFNCSLYLYQIPEGTYVTKYLRWKYQEKTLAYLLEPHEFSVKNSEITYLGKFNVEPELNRFGFIRKFHISLIDSANTIRDKIDSNAYLNLKNVAITKDLLVIKIK
jgi:hypothetical protein